MLIKVWFYNSQIGPYFYFSFVFIFQYGAYFCHKKRTDIIYLTTKSKNMAIVCRPVLLRCVAGFIPTLPFLLDYKVNIHVHNKKVKYSMCQYLEKLEYLSLATKWIFSENNFKARQTFILATVKKTLLIHLVHFDTVCREIENWANFLSLSIDK